MLFGPVNAKAQFIDRYSISVGTTYATQEWDYVNWPDWENNKSYRLGFTAFLSAEKDLNKLFVFRSNFGYMQNGFTNDLKFTLIDGSDAGPVDKDVVFHNLILDLSFKFAPFSAEYSPYLFLGARGGYRISYNDAYFSEEASGKSYPVFGARIDELSKFGFSGIMGFGIDLGKSFYVEMEYNPGFKRKLIDEAVEIKDICWVAKLGYYFKFN